MDTEIKLIRNEDFYSVVVEGDTLLYRPTSQKAVHLDNVSSVILQLCDGTRTATEVAQEMATFYPDDADTVIQDVLETISTLYAQDALVDAT